MLVFLCQYRFTLIEMKDFLKNRGETCSRLGCADENIAHLGLPAFAGPTGRHNLQVTLKIIDLHISEKLSAPQIDGIILAPGAFQIRQEFWPDLPVALAIFLLCTGPDPHHKSDALHRT